ncbi:hypothetical protein VNI00_015560 [Paramarasmius palmivorus]|uniref:Nephrocystin 3-like N-terminal domain-containing protein n=1 Tax=Paramarasmius palmivorus TaxID=297713 RepID=A0AAW0BJY7_9AGAR
MIAHISTWIEDASKTTSIFWLHGTAGLGKSAIAQHIAEKYAALKMLGGAFFFSRNDPTRDNIGPFVATIAYQFCKARSPLGEVLGPKIIDNIAGDPNTFHVSCESQLRQLVLEPCFRVEPAVRNALPNLLIVDGLDECVDIGEQERVLELLQMLLTAPTFPSWTILLCSRLESQIRDALHHPNFNGHLVSFDMNTSDELNRDIANYLNDEFFRLRGKYQRVLREEGVVWPGYDVIDELVRRADKQVIFAATVIKYIDTRDELPQMRLERIRLIFVKADTESPYSALDLLYHQILSTCGKWEQVRPILRLLVTPHDYPYHLHMDDDNTSWRSPGMIARFLGVQEAQVQVTLEKLHSILRIPLDKEKCSNNNNDDGNIYIAHATFTEFLGDRCRSLKFYTPKLTQSEYCEFLAIFSLQTLADLACRYPPYHIQSFTEAMLSWEQKWEGINTQLLQTLVLLGWRSWEKATFPPSLVLVEALSNLDVYHFIGLWHRDWFNRHRSEVTFVVDLREQIGLKKQIELAKSRESMPRQFIEKLEILDDIEQLNLAFPPHTEGNFVFWWTRWAENCCWTRSDSSRTLEDIFLPRSSLSQKFLVLSADSSHHRMLVPEDWIIVPIMKENSELEQRLYDVLQFDSRSDLYGKERIFLEDVRNHTHYSVTKRIVAETVKEAPEDRSGAFSQAA